ncbi:MAG: hypothetical protein AMXMBFR33_44300 [Candidatus Xenobia bacterium]
MLYQTNSWGGSSIASPFMNGNQFGGPMNANPYNTLASIMMLFALFEAMARQGGQQQPGNGNCCWSDPRGFNSAMNYDPCYTPSGCVPDLSCWTGGHREHDHDHAGASASASAGSASASASAAVAVSASHNDSQNASASAAAAASVSVEQQQQQQVQSSGGDGGGDGGGGGGGGGGTPVILDLNGDGKLDTTGKGGAKISFDLNADGKQDKLEWMSKGSQDGLLVHDYNGDGVINDGRELMRRTGENGEQDKYKNGWDKVAQLYDKNRDGVVKGEELNGLQMWVDSNGDAKTDRGELKSLAELGISSIDLPKREGEMDSTFVRNGRTQLARDYDFELANPIA